MFLVCFDIDELVKEDFGHLKKEILRWKYSKVWDVFFLVGWTDMVNIAYHSFFLGNFFLQFTSFFLHLKIFIMAKITNFDYIKNLLCFKFSSFITISPSESIHILYSFHLFSLLVSPIPNTLVCDLRLVLF